VARPAIGPKLLGVLKDKRSVSVIPVALALAGYSLAGVSCTEDTEARYEAMLSTLVESERAFASAAAEHGTLEAFRTYLADDGVLFRPRAVNAQEWLSAQPDAPGLLSWEPVLADIAEAGDLGFTTGPWNFRADRAAAPAAHGNFFSVWKKQADGAWRVMIDHGISNPPPEVTEQLRSPAGEPGSHSWWELDVDVVTELEILLQVDRAFAAASVANGMLQALTAHVNSDVRALRDGIQPLLGIEALRELISERPGTVEWTVLGGDVSRSGDLGYTYGEYTFVPGDPDEPGEQGNYVRAWRRGPNGSGIWRVVVDVMSSIPPSSN
jgi:ketosteroid isomerase-like protein